MIMYIVLIMISVLGGRASLSVIVLICDISLLNMIGCSAWCRDGVSILMRVVIRVGPVGFVPPGWSFRFRTVYISDMIWMYSVI